MTGTNQLPVEEASERRVLRGHALRRAIAPTRVALARLRSRPGRNLLLVVGIAAAAAMLAVVLGGTTVARELSLQRMVRALPIQDRSFRVDLTGLPAEGNRARNDIAARRALAGLASAPPFRVVAFRDFWLDGQFVRISGIDGRPDAVRLVSGRLPRRCGPHVCEVLQLGPHGRAFLQEGDIHLVRVGIGELRRPATFGPAFLRLRQLRAQASWVTATVMLGPSAAAVERYPPLELIARLASWAVPLEASTIHSWQVPGVLAHETRAQTLLDRVDPALTVVGPDAALVEASARGDAYDGRMALVGGGLAAALLGFALVAAVGMRRGLAAERRRLAQRGATRWQVVVATLTEVGALAAVGWAAGIVAGAVVVGVLAATEGLPAAATLRHSLLTGEAVISLTAGLVLSLLVLALVVAGEEGSRRSRIRPLDVAAAGAVLAVVVGIGRGDLHADTVASGGEQAFLVALPALVCLAGALLAARLLGPLMRLAERLARGGSIAVRLALLALARAPARTAAAAAFLVVTIGLAVFAAAYRSTLDRGARDEAAFTVPLDVVLTAGASPVQPAQAGAPDDFSSLAPGVRAFPILRTTATVAGAGTSVQSPTVLGVPSDALAAMRWRSDFSGSSRASLVARSRPRGDVKLRTVALPLGARTVELEARLRGTPLALALVVRDGRGRMGRVQLGTARPGHTRLSALIPAGRPGTRPREVVALELTLPKSERAWLLHLGHERRIVRAPSGEVSIGALEIDGSRTLTAYRGWLARGQDATVVGRDPRAVRVSYAFPDVANLYLRPRQPTDLRGVAVIASPAVAKAAGPGGLITLDFYDSRVRARVVGVATRFPTVGEGEEFVVGDERALATALDADAPGTGAPGDVWLSVPADETAAVDRALARPPFARLDRAFRERLLEQTRSDPLARGLGATLGAAALTALLLALAGLWAALLGDLRDERDTLFDLEAQGADPGTLRRHLRLRALALLGFGLAGGLLLGIVLSRLVVSVVQVTASATDPVPPLVLDAGLGSVAVVLALLFGVAVLAIELTVRSAFRGPAPERASWSFE